LACSGDHKTFEAAVNEARQVAQAALTTIAASKQAAMQYMSHEARENYIAAEKDPQVRAALQEAMRP